jgi:hypothetical protein
MIQLNPANMDAKSKQRRVGLLWRTGSEEGQIC